MKYYVLIILFLFSCFNCKECFSQTKDPKLGGTLVLAIIKDGDTIYTYQYPDVYVFEHRTFKSESAYRRYMRLVMKVKKVYPYAKMAGEKLNEYHKLLANVKSEQEKKKIMAQVEDNLREQFEDDIKNLTFSEGKILLKLIDRETGNTSYEIVKELRGSFRAFFWQQVARLFGTTLKMEYDPKEEDKLIEDIVIAIENGQL